MSTARPLAATVPRALSGGRSPSCHCSARGQGMGVSVPLHPAGIRVPTGTKADVSGVSWGLALPLALHASLYGQLGASRCPECLLPLGRDTPDTCCSHSSASLLPATSSRKPALNPFHPTGWLRSTPAAGLPLCPGPVRGPACLSPVAPWNTLWRVLLPQQAAPGARNGGWECGAPQLHAAPHGNQRGLAHGGDRTRGSGSQGAGVRRRRLTRRLGLPPEAGSHLLGWGLVGGGLRDLEDQLCRRDWGGRAQAAQGSPPEKCTPQASSRAALYPTGRSQAAAPRTSLSPDPGLRTHARAGPASSLPSVAPAPGFAVTQEPKEGAGRPAHLSKEGRASLPACPSLDEGHGPAARLASSYLQRH